MNVAVESISRLSSLVRRWFRAHECVRLGEYVLDRKLGQGGMAEVYLARHTRLGREAALKLLPAERAGLGTVARFEREIRVTSRLTHPNIVAIYDYGRTSEGAFYYAMEHLQGADLERLVTTEGPLPPERVVPILLQIADALAEAHAIGLIHRDLKPANVFLCDRGGTRETVKVLDFGLVKERNPEAGGYQTDVNVLIGTPAYIAPEAICTPGDLDARSDLYALGAVAYYLLTGEQVFEGDTVVAQCIAHLHEAPLPPSMRVGRVLPRDLEQLILRCLAKQPERRPNSAAAFREALLACNLSSRTPSATSAVPAPSRRFLGSAA